MSEINSEDVSAAILEIRDLLKLIAEPSIAKRDQEHRNELKQIVGSSGPKAEAALLMDGRHTQAAIHKETGMRKGNLSTFVKQLQNAKFLLESSKEPKLVISVPANFFSSEPSK